MQFRTEVKGWRFYIGLSRSAKVKGVNSKLEDGKHFLMWDFDNVPEELLRGALIDVQLRFALPRIYVLNTGLKGYYHAYCFKRFEWPDVLKILASTQHLDKVYFNIGVLRGFFTLRTTPKKNRPLAHAFTLRSAVKEDVEPKLEINSFVRYWTKRV